MSNPQTAMPIRQAIIIWSVCAFLWVMVAGWSLCVWLRVKA